MFNPFASSEESKKLDEQIDTVLESMTTYGPDTPEYPDLLALLERLNAQKAKQPGFRISPDTLAIVVGNLVGILIIVGYEQTHVVTSKGFGNILKPEVKNDPPKK